MTNDRRDMRPWLIRLWNPTTRRWLRYDAQAETADVNLSWSGTREQAKTLRQRATERGNEWPYEIAALEEVREGND